jgi:hypothetical protein
MIVFKVDLNTIISMLVHASTHTVLILVNVSTCTCSQQVTIQYNTIKIMVRYVRLPVRPSFLLNPTSPQDKGWNSLSWNTPRPKPHGLLHLKVDCARDRTLLSGPHVCEAPLPGWVVGKKPYNCCTGVLPLSRKPSLQQQCLSQRPFIDRPAAPSAVCLS